MAKEAPGETGARVSAVIPVYNGADFLHSAIESVYAQTVLPGEIIVVNDGSSDGTETILRELADAADPPLRWVTTPNRGEASARNLGVEMANGDFIAFLDHDDVWHPSKLARQLEHFAATPSLSLSFTAYLWCENGSSEPVQHAAWDSDPSAVLERLLLTPSVGPPSTVMVRREALRRVPEFDETLWLGNDWLMWLHIAAAGLRIGYIAEPLVDYRWHGGNMSRGERLYFEAGCNVFDRFFKRGQPPEIQRRGRRWRSHWHLDAAIHARQTGDRSGARRHILTAMRIHPGSIRPGWLRMLGIGAPPQ